MSTDRLFIAIPVGGAQRTALQQLGNTLQSALPFSKWVHPHDLHLTLKFLGDTDPVTAKRVREKLREITAGSQPFSLGLNELGTFGRPSSPSILWMGVRGDMNALAALHAKVETAVAPLGFAPEDRPFRPHITMARKYKGEAAFPEAELRNAAADALSTPSEWMAEHVILYRTHLGRQPMYEALDTFVLGG
ncbi:RNA 2',3'-cyclic phosphodiesterase [Paenibacillus sp. H1-7]|uniref:RNA 2',3'-cyclic phosphodiesterase n=1 Tax=Paenibacillus sp. H1-7 TaxID=2282849 RepID=UPI001EF98A69|nr:RNA 2',3'-cyclic phosphodiesterase [Paenibacillus sp. H1-7]ULL14223.1 RNA 2',3'-cyclic phosphodiesterase [Paenibacillus sp. H1-7]